MANFQLILLFTHLQNHPSPFSRVFLMMTSCYPQKLVDIKFFLRQYFPETLEWTILFNLEVTNSKENTIKSKKKQSIIAYSPAPYIVYFFQDKTTPTKKRRKKTIKIETASSIKKLLFSLLSSFLSKWHYERNTLILQILCFFLNHHPVWPPGYTTPDCHMGISPALTHINIGY